MTVTVNDQELILEITGAKAEFAKIINQVFWVVSVASPKSITLLHKYAQEVEGGKATRETAETLYTGVPAIDKRSDGKFNVSFSNPVIQEHAIRGQATKKPECWKTMLRLAIVASGYPIPKRPKPETGLEVNLEDLGQLFMLGFEGNRFETFEKPLFVAPKQLDKDRFQARMLLATEVDSGFVYWHCEAAKVFPSIADLETFYNEIRIDASAIKINSRHFLGWSNEAGIRAGKQPNNSWGDRLGWPPAAWPDDGAA